ncbi:MAG: hypothetical protein RIR62_1021 [Pseudomonadota bacterium]
MTAPRKGAWSIRWRLTRGVLAVALLAWLGTAGLTLWYLEVEINEALDQEMALVAETMILSLDTGPVVPRVVGMPTGSDERVLRISRLAGAPPDAPWAQPAEDGYSDAEGWRILRQTGDTAVVEVAHARAWRREEMWEAGSALLVLILPLVALLILGVSRVLTQTLAPVVTLARQIGGRMPDDLSPVGGADIPTELRPLATALDSYLARIAALRDSERRFVANAAHELRTPVAAIRATLGSAPDRAATAAMLDDLTRRIERLLQLARSEAGVGLGRGPCDLALILRLLVEDARRRPDADIRFDDGDHETLQIAADADAVAILLRNLIENAQDHGTGQVRVTLLADGRVTVENPTDGTEFLDEPFRKGAGSRGMGLGLSIVASLAGTMGAGMERRIGNGTARVTVRFPRA